MSELEVPDEEWQVKLKRHLKSTQHFVYMHLLIVASLIALFWCEFTLQYYPYDVFSLRIYSWVAFFFNTVHLIELISFIAAFGIRYVVS